MKTVKDFEIKTERIVVDGRKYIATDEGNLFIMHDCDASSPFEDWGLDINFLSFESRGKSYGLGEGMEYLIEKSDNYEAIKRLLRMKGFDTLEVDKFGFTGFVFFKKGYSKEMVEDIIKRHLLYLEGETYLIKIEDNEEDEYLASFYGIDDVNSYLKQYFRAELDRSVLLSLIIYQ